MLNIVKNVYLVAKFLHLNFIFLRKKTIFTQ